MVIALPWPPSVNHYWERNRNGSVRVGQAGRAYRDTVGWKCRQERISGLRGRLAVSIKASPPDRRKRDLDNLLKAILDALQHGGAYEDDSQIDELTIKRLPPSTPGFVTVEITASSSAPATPATR